MAEQGERNRSEAFATVSKACQTVLLGCKWLVNLVVKEEDCSPAIDNIIQNSSTIFAFVHTYTQVAEDPGQPLQAGDRLYHEIIAQTSCSLKNRLVSLFRIAVAINISLTSGDISLKNLHRQNLDEVIKHVVNAIRKLCYSVKRDPYAHPPYAPPSLSPSDPFSDPLAVVKNAVLMLRNWVDLFAGASLAVQRPEWRQLFVQKKAALVEALTGMQTALSNSAFDLTTDIHDTGNLMKRALTLGDALAKNPLNEQCREQLESTVFEGLDLVRRVLPFLRREFSGTPESATGPLMAADPIVAKDTEIPEPVFDEADAGEDDPTHARLSAIDRLSIRGRAGSEPSTSTDTPTDVSPAPSPTPIHTPANPTPSSSPSPVSTTVPVAQEQPATIRNQGKSTSTTVLRTGPSSLKNSSTDARPVRPLESLKKKPYSALDLRVVKRSTVIEPIPENPTQPENQVPASPPPSETPYTPPPLRYAFSEKKNRQSKDLQMEMDHSPSFDDILVMLQDDNERLASEQLQPVSSLQKLEDGLKNKVLPPEPREDVRASTALSSYVSIDVPQVVPTKEYVIERTGQESKRYTANFAINLENPENYFGYYSEHFYGNEHLNYVGNVRDLGGPVAISITKFVDPNTKKYMAVIRTRTGDTRLLLQAKSPKPKDLYAALLRAIAPAAVKSKNLTLINDPNLQKSLLKFEKSQLLTCFKIAVLYAGPGQTKETDFYTNTKHSADFEEFLNFLGDRIELQGWKEFRAGLDVRTNTTGTHSVFTKFMELSIMFHVSTFLPFFPLDEQQVERKRHLGNDIVMILFQEGDQPFSPEAITSEFNQVFFVVRKIATEDGSTSYQLSIVTHDMISPFGPMIPDPPIFKKSAFFRRWLLTKLINSESAAYAAPAIALKLNRARGELLDSIYKEFCHK